MTVLSKAGLVLAVVALVSGCGADEEKSQPAPPVQKLPADTHPKSNPFGGLTPSVIDTLRAKKRIYHVTRDEYWDDRGGVLGNDYFDVWYPAGRVTVTHGMLLLEEAMIARANFQMTFGKAPEDKLNLVMAADMTNYLLRAEREWWYYSVVKEDTLVFQPVYVLVKRGLGAIAISHEYSQWAVRKLSLGKAPRWLEEGMASLMSGEKNVLIDQLWEFDERSWKQTPDEIETILVSEKERQPTRIAYYHAFKMAEKLQATFGRDALAAFILKLGEAPDRDSASREVFNKSYKELLAAASTYSMDRKK